ncbi:MAG: hypothetical protein ACRD19_11260 [Terriglobia bacterium]
MLKRQLLDKTAKYGRGGNLSGIAAKYERLTVDLPIDLRSHNALAGDNKSSALISPDLAHTSLARHRSVATTCADQLEVSIELFCIGKSLEQISIFQDLDQAQPQ